MSKHLPWRKNGVQNILRLRGCFLNRGLLLTLLSLGICDADQYRCVILYKGRRLHLLNHDDQQRTMFAGKAMPARFVP